MSKVGGVKTGCQGRKGDETGGTPASASANIPAIKVKDFLIPMVSRVWRFMAN